MEESPTVTPFLPQSERFLYQRSEFYKPLDFERVHFRLMHIQPAPFEDESIRITVSEIYLDDPVDFEAISYTWGDLGHTKEILIHDLPYIVTTNQYAALRRFRRPDQVRTMWMDVICIDQANLEERSHQVSVMGSIYASSSHTVIWLSEIEDEWMQGISDHEWNNGILGRQFHTQRSQGQEMQVFAAARLLGGVKGPKRTDLMTMFREQIELSNGIVRGACLILELFAQRGHFHELPSYQLNDNEGVEFYRPWFKSAKLLYRLMCHPWWTRLWVLQEVLLCKNQLTVVFGDNELPYATFTAAASAFTSQVVNCRCCNLSVVDIFLEEWTMPMGTAFAKIRLLSERSDISTPGRMTLNNARALTQDRHASDIRDFVYGILGLVKKEQHVKVSYKIPAAELFAQTSFDLFKMRNELTLLENGSVRTESRLQNLPTWSMDWTKVGQVGFSHNWTFTGDENELPDWNKVLLNITTGILQLEANELDSIQIMLKTDSGPPGTPIKIASTVKRIFSSWADQLRNVGVEIDIDHRTMKRETMSMLSKELFITVYRDTKVTVGKNITDKICTRFGNEQLDAVVQWWTGLNEIADALAKNPEDFEMRSRYEDRYPSFLVSELRYSLENSSLALTRNGRLCMVPSVAEPGDQIYHVRACKPPLILRAVSSLTASHFRVVGPGFLHGSMGSAGWQQDAEKVIYLV